MVKMLIDVDTGVDDSIALLYALNHPEVEIVGITTGCGNVDAVQAAENTVRIIELSNTKKEIPVVVGANQPLNGTWEGPVAWIHGENGVGNVLLEKGNFLQNRYQSRRFSLRDAAEIPAGVNTRNIGTTD